MVDYGSTKIPSTHHGDKIINLMIVVINGKKKKRERERKKRGTSAVKLNRDFKHLTSSALSTAPE